MVMRTPVALAAAIAAGAVVHSGFAQPLAVGDQAPPISLEAMLQAPVEAGDVSWESLRGKAVVLEFWATWCAPCLAAMPHLNELADALADEPIRFISITNEDEQTIREFLAQEKARIAGWVGLDTDRSMFEAYGVTGIPHTVLVDGQGVVRGVTHANSVTEEALRQLIAGRPMEIEGKTDFDALFSKIAITADGPAPVFESVVRPSMRATPAIRFGAGKWEASGISPIAAFQLVWGVDDSRVDARAELPDQRFDFLFNANGRQDLLRQLQQAALQAAFNVTARLEQREVEAYVLRGETTKAERLVSPSGFGYDLQDDGVTTSMTRSLAAALRQALGASVFDETRLPSRFYDFKLTWGADDPASIIRAVRERLGLELVRERREVDVLVIEPFEKEEAGGPIKRTFSRS